MPRRHLSSGKALRLTRDVRKVTTTTVLGWFVAFRNGVFSRPLPASEVRSLCTDIFGTSWKLNLSHLKRWLTLAGLANASGCDEDTGKMTSSTNAQLFLSLCRRWGWPHTYESLHTAFLHALENLDVPPAARVSIARLAQSVSLEDTPGNACKVVCAAETLLFGSATNSFQHDIDVTESSLQSRLLRHHTFRA